MEEIIKHIDMEMLKSYSYQGSYTDEYLFFTDKLENIFQENKNVKLEFLLNDPKIRNYQSNNTIKVDL